MASGSMAEKCGHDLTGGVADMIAPPLALFVDRGRASKALGTLGWACVSPEEQAWR